MSRDETFAALEAFHPQPITTWYEQGSHVERAAQLARENEALRAEIERLKKEADDVRRDVDAAQDSRGRP